MTSRTRLPPIDARAPRPAQLRAGPLMHVPVLLREFGVDPAAVLSRAGVDPRWLDDAENPIAFDAAGRLLDACVRATGCAHFGLIAGQRLDERALGALFMHFMIETILTGYALGIDPFDQPAVEDGKILTRKYLSDMARGGLQ